MQTSIFSSSEKETIQIGKKLGAQAKPGDIFCLSGDLGSGKTTLVKGIAKGLKISPESVHSPTFVLMNIYEGKLPLYHFDLYRLENIKEIQVLGYEEFFFAEGLTVVEWAERLQELTPQDYLKVELRHKGEGRRQLILSAKGKKASQRLKTFKGP